MVNKDRLLLVLIAVADTLPIYLVAAACADATDERCVTKPASFYLDTLPPTCCLNEGHMTTDGVNWSLMAYI